MKIYSHSRLSTYEQCPLKFKYRYIDQIIPEVGETIESLLGKVVHDTLEWLYLLVKKGRVPTIDEIMIYYSTKWERDYDPKITIVKKDLTNKDYFNKGVKFLIDYYMKHKPFNDNTLEVEKGIVIEIGDYKIRGFIDRLSHNLKKDEYEIHDYKTSNNLPTQEKINKDRQLALYSIAIKELFGYEKNICLIWHYLAHNQKIYSKRTNEELEQLKKDIIKLIEKIESTKEFHSNKTILCGWCEYKSMCPQFGGKPPEIQNKLI